MTILSNQSSTSIVLNQMRMYRSALFNELDYLIKRVLRPPFVSLDGVRIAACTGRRHGFQ